MRTLAGSGGILDQRQPLKGLMAKSVLLHAVSIGLLAAYAFLHGFFHGAEWGSNSFQQGAIQATLVSSAALPLPQVHPPTDNVLATENPSPAPELDEQKTAPIPLPEAVPIPVKQKPVKEKPKPHEKTPPKHPEKVVRPKNRLTYGEAAPTSIPRATSPTQQANSPVQVQGGDFGSRFGWYVDVIKRKVAQNWYLQEVQPGTPGGATVYIEFNIARDGSPRDARIATSSGYPTLDSSCLRAIQRVDTFGPLPAGYNQSSLNVLYHCTYPGTH